MKGLSLSHLLLLTLSPTIPPYEVPATWATFILKYTTPTSGPLYVQLEAHARSLQELLHFLLAFAPKRLPGMKSENPT